MSTVRSHQEDAVADISCRSMQDVVGFAIQKEENTMEFYLDCAGRAKNPGIKAFFQEMAEEEERHREMLAGLDPQDLSDIRLERTEDLRIGDYLVDLPFHPDITYQDALILAMKKEEKAHAFYAGWKDKCANEKTARLFEILAEEEAKHKHRLETIYDEEILTWD